jgi:hypothetical protein
MMDIKRDLYAKLLCQISGGINEEGTSLMKLYLQAKTLVKAKKLESLKKLMELTIIHYSKSYLELSPFLLRTEGKQKHMLCSFSSSLMLLLVLTFKSFRFCHTVLELCSTFLQMIPL